MVKTKHSQEPYWEVSHQLELAKVVMFWATEFMAPLLLLAALVEIIRVEAAEAELAALVVVAVGKLY